MRDAAIVELGVREASAFCSFAETAYGAIDKSGRQDAIQTFFYIHAFLGHCATVARLLWSPALAAHAGGRTLAELLDIPQGYKIDDDAVRQVMERYDVRLAGGLSLRGEVAKILDHTTGDRDAFEEESSLFLRHYDPTVDVFTLMEEEFNLARIAAEVADVRERAENWIATRAVLTPQPAEPSIPPRR